MFKITKDKIENGKIVGNIYLKPKNKNEKDYKYKHKFRLLDDDKNIYYYGWFYSNDDDLGEEAFEPLWYMQPLVGVIEIQYKNKDTEEYKML